MAKKVMESDGGGISISAEEFDDMVTANQSGGSYGVRDLDADVANGADEATGTVNVDAIAADSDPETEPVGDEHIDPNAVVAQAGGSTEEGSSTTTYDDEGNVNVTTVGETVGGGSDTRQTTSPEDIRQSVFRIERGAPWGAIGAAIAGIGLVYSVIAGGD